MHGVFSNRGLTATKVNDISVASENWFKEMCDHLFGDDRAGALLRYDSDAEPRNCQRYARGGAKPSGDFIRALLRSENGWSYLCGIMDGSDAEWWRETQAARNCVAAFDLVRREFEKH